MAATQKPNESEERHHMINEDDIGSGEKTPGEKETDEQIRQIPVPQGQSTKDGARS